MSDAGSVQLPRWKSHKEVWADKIVKAEPLALTTRCGGLINLDDTDIGKRIEAAERKPEVGDYVVIYDDGYASWSPAKAFEEGYTRL